MNKFELSKEIKLKLVCSLAFVDDVYPDTAANIPAITATEWFQGRNAQPIMMLMETKQPKMVNDVQNTKYKQNNEHQHQHHYQSNQTTPPIESKLTIIDSNYNLNIKSNLNGLNKHKDNDNNKMAKSCDNNSKKFAFLAQQTIPDYRPQQVNVHEFSSYSAKNNLFSILFFPYQMTEKRQKTSSNQSTKFHQLQALFGHQGATIKEIANIQNSLMTTPKNGTPNSSLENIDLTETEVCSSNSFESIFFSNFSMICLVQTVTESIKSSNRRE